MTLGYPRSDMVLALKGQRSRLGLGLTAIRRQFELYECLLVFILNCCIMDVCYTVDREQQCNRQRWTTEGWTTHFGGTDMRLSLRLWLKVVP